MILDDSIRLMLEEQERQTLSPHACQSSQSRGRRVAEKPCFIRTAFQRDTDRIIHSEAFRRLKHKTQVFLAPTNDHFRTRMTHTLEVVGVARTIARGLRLNVDLAEAIAYGHDLGHTPFGHAGEQVLNEISPQRFHHATHSLRVAEQLEKNGRGLNLSLEVLDGIVKHSKGRKGALFTEEGPDAPLTLEAAIVRISDLIAYLNHDIDDAMRAGLITVSDLPPEATQLLGSRHAQRIHTMVKDIISTSRETCKVRMSGEVWEATEQLRAFLYEKVYPRPEIESEIQKSKALLRQMADWFLEHPNALMKHLKHAPPPEQPLVQTLVDYLASMTDAFAISIFKELFLPHYRLDMSLIPRAAGGPA
ncbi:MAG TPA: deoxyguanosinetriphosphate triphosphohydrolase [Candidatus Ozemobacteraceae bacterium]|nr:deoxyguanosinetriphosphate triphosphohydrolase [Candidatus Ozemobacteraceae bacterium]